jgi:hypothetical protein
MRHIGVVHPNRKEAEMPKALNAIARWFKPVPAVIKFLTETDDFTVVPNPRPEQEKPRRELNG